MNSNSLLMLIQSDPSYPTYEGAVLSVTNSKPAILHVAGHIFLVRSVLNLVV